MSTCPFCSEEIAADSAECPSCGMELPGPSHANVGDAPPVQPSKSNAKKWILIGGAGCGFCVLILACLAALLLPMVSRARDAVRKQAAEAAARNDQFPDSDEQLLEMMESGSSEDDSGSGDGPVPLATTVPSAETAPGSQPEPGETSVQAADDAVAALKKLDAKTKENEQGEVVEVNLGGTRVTDTELVHLKGLTKLQTLELGDTQITDAGLVHLKGLTKLRTLRLGSTKITDAGLVHLKGLTKLQTLNLNFCRQIADAGLEQLKGMTELKNLYLYGTKITDAGLVHLKGLARLQQFGLDGTSVTGVGLVHLKELNKLQYLNLDGTRVTDTELVHLKGLTGLQSLNLSNTKVTEMGLMHLAGLKLKSLSVPKHSQTDQGLKHYLAALEPKRFLTLSSEWSITDAGLVHLKGQSTLRSLNLRGTKITDSGLVHLKGLTQLQYLGLQQTKVTAAGVADLQKSLPNCKISK